LNVFHAFQSTENCFRAPEAASGQSCHFYPSCIFWLQFFLTQSLISGLWFIFIGLFMKQSAVGSYQAAVLKQALAEFGVDVNVEAVNPGPVITQYEVSPMPGIKISRIPFRVIGVMQEQGGSGIVDDINRQGQEANTQYYEKPYLFHFFFFFLLFLLI
jgi:hypothetical protein